MTRPCIVPTAAASAEKAGRIARVAPEAKLAAYVRVAKTDAA